jgi:hypothetical protein
VVIDGDVTICELPFVSHCVVLGATLVHWGVAEAVGAATAAPMTAESAARQRIINRIVGLLGPRK